MPQIFWIVPTSPLLLLLTEIWVDAFTSGSKYTWHGCLSDTSIVERPSANLQVGAFNWKSGFYQVPGRWQWASAATRMGEAGNRRCLGPKCSEMIEHFITTLFTVASKTPPIYLWKGLILIWLLLHGLNICKLYIDIISSYVVLPTITTVIFILNSPFRQIIYH